MKRFVLQSIIVFVAFFLLNACSSDSNPEPNSGSRLSESSNLDFLYRNSTLESTIGALHTILLDTHKITSGCYLLVLEGQYPAKVIKKLMVVH